MHTEMLEKGFKIIHAEKIHMEVIIFMFFCRLFRSHEYLAMWISLIIPTQATHKKNSTTHFMYAI